MRQPKCVFTGSNLKLINKLDNFPVFMGTTTQPLNEDKFFDLHWAVSEAGIVQLMNRYPLELLYSQSHNSGVVGGLWDQHHTEFASFIADFKPKSVIEVGGGHAILAEKYIHHDRSVNWTIFEPNPLKRDLPNITYRREFFSKASVIPNPIDCIIHSHFFEHLYDPLDFLKTAYDRLPLGGKMIFSIPNMIEMLARGYVNSLNIEHTIYLPEYLIDALLKASGFELIQKRYFKSDHSIFYCCCKSKLPRTDNKFDFGRRSLTEYTDYIASRANEINELKLSVNQNTGRRVFLFGAHIFSQHLIYHGLGNGVVAVLDNDVTKQGKRLYGTDLLVNSPEIVANEDNPVVVLRAGVYNDEITAQLKQLNTSVAII